MMDKEQNGKEFVYFVLDIVSVFAGKLDIPFSDSTIGKLDTDGWADSVEFPGLLQLVIRAHQQQIRIFNNTE